MNDELDNDVLMRKNRSIVDNTTNYHSKKIEKKTV
jgi:hypothetical protein